MTLRAERSIKDEVVAAIVTIRSRLMLRWTAFEFRHRRLVDDLTAALVTLLSIAAWCAAFALFNE